MKRLALLALILSCDDGSPEMAPPAQAVADAGVCRNLGEACQRNEDCCDSAASNGAPPRRQCSTRGLGGVGVCERR